MEGSGRHRASLVAIAAAVGCRPAAPAEGPLLVTPPADPSQVGAPLPGAFADDAGAGGADAATEGGSLVPSLNVGPRGEAPLPDDASAMLVPLATSWKAPPPRRTAGRCWERYGDLPAAALASARKEFHARNPGWRVPRGGIDALFGTVRVAELGAPPAGHRSAAGDIQRSAISFARRNADLLGLVERDFVGMDWKLEGVPRGATPPPQWRVVGESPPNTANSPFHELERRVWLELYVTPEGEVAKTNARVVPQGSVCTEPAISAEAAMRAAGVKRAGDDGVGDPARVVLSVTANDGPAGHENRLVYRVPVQRGTVTTVLIDAVSGKVFTPPQARRF